VVKEALHVPGVGALVYLKDPLATCWPPASLRRIQARRWLSVFSRMDN